MGKKFKITQDNSPNISNCAALLLNILSEKNQPLDVKELTSLLVSIDGTTKEEQRIMVKNVRRNKLNYSIHWALVLLKRNNLVNRIKRGTYEATTNRSDLLDFDFAKKEIIQLQYKNRKKQK